ncbi:MAG: hypothetical protein WCK89_19780 [bacterium]
MNFKLSLLSNLSPSNQRSIGLTAGALVTCLLVFFFAVRPKQKKILQGLQDVNTLNQTLSHILADIATTDSLKQQVADANVQRETLLTSGVIEPLLGSFAMRGKALLDPVAQATGFSIVNVKELTSIPLQLPKPAPEQTYGRQPVEFTGHGSYAQITAFITQTEAAQPLATLSSLLILCQQQTPETHKAIITFEWPIKGEKIKPSVPPNK